MNEQGKATLENTVSNDVLNPLKVEFTPIENSKQNGLAIVDPSTTWIKCMRY